MSCSEANESNSTSRQNCSSWKETKKVVFIDLIYFSLRQRVDDISEDIEHNPAGEGAVGMGYISLAQGESKADDQSIQISKMYDLLESSDKELDHIKTVLDKYNEKQSIEDIEGIPKNLVKEPLKYLDNQIWKVEIDVENVNDV